MISVTAIRVIDDPVPLRWTDQHSFASADGEWTARFTNPFEWHMGATGWRLRLAHRARNVSLWHPWLRVVKTSRGYDLPLQYVPWSALGHVLAVVPWHDPGRLCLYRPDRHLGSKHDLPAPVLGVQWAPAGSRLAIAHPNRVDIVDDTGARVVSIPLAHPPREYLRVFWWRDGSRLLVVGRAVQTEPASLRVYDAESGALRDTVGLDPADLLSYDKDRFARIGRDGWTLLTGPDVRTVGSQLDTWSRVEFDSVSGVLRAFVYRPSGAARMEGDQLVCPAAERAVEVVVSST